MPDTFDVGVSFEIILGFELFFTHNIPNLNNVGFYSSLIKKESKIDILAISSKGIFVIEAKNFKTLLEGDINDNLWVGKTNRRVSIYNVYLQNLLHTRLISNFLAHNKFKINDVPIYNVIVVPDGCSIQSDYDLIFQTSGFFIWVESLPTIDWDYKSVYSFLLDYLIKK